MKKELEDYLYSRIHKISDEIGFYNLDMTPRSIIEEMLEKGMINSPKQAWATLEKWERKGLYEDGTSLDLGWITEEQ